jgi:hypothetical protein
VAAHTAYEIVHSICGTRRTGFDMEGFGKKAVECRAVAQEIRARASAIIDPVNRASLLSIALGYERLALRLDAHQTRQTVADENAMPEAKTS